MTDNYVKIMSAKAMTSIHFMAGKPGPELLEHIREGGGMGAYTHAVAWDDGKLTTIYTSPSWKPGRVTRRSEL